MARAKKPGFSVSDRNHFPEGFRVAGSWPCRETQKPGFFRTRARRNGKALLVSRRLRIRFRLLLRRPQVPGQSRLFFVSPRAVILRSKATKNLSFPQRNWDSSLPTVAQNDKRAREQDKCDCPTPSVSQFDASGAVCYNPRCNRRAVSSVGRAPAF